jgi:hypothetical protein
MLARRGSALLERRLAAAGDDDLGAGADAPAVPPAEVEAALAAPVVDEARAARASSPSPVSDCGAARQRARRRPLGRERRGELRVARRIPRADRARCRRGLGALGERLGPATGGAV